MFLKNALVRKAFATIGADVRPVFVRRVHRQDMDPQFPTVGESFGTLAALERPVVRMHPHVADQARALGESFSAHLALERFLSGVHPPVHRIRPPERELLAAVRTEIALVVSVDAPVSRQIAPVAVALAAIGALVRFLSGVFAHVVAQFFGKSKCHVTERARMFFVPFRVTLESNSIGKRFSANRTREPPILSYLIFALIRNRTARRSDFFAKTRTFTSFRRNSLIFVEPLIGINVCRCFRKMEGSSSNIWDWNNKCLVDDWNQLDDECLTRSDLVWYTEGIRGVGVILRT